VCQGHEFAVESLKLAKENVLRKYGLTDGVYAGMTFESYIPANPKQEVAKQVAMEVIDEWRNGNWGVGLILAGTDVGVGKTHLAISMAREGVQIYIPELGERILAIWSVPDLLTKIKNSYSNGGPEEITASVTDSGIVVLDDLGVEHLNKETWYQEIMYNILNARWLGQKATVITTNMTDSQMKARLGERTYSRLRAMVPRMVRVSGEDYRMKRHG